MGCRVGGLYKAGACNEGFRLASKALWLLNGALQAAIAFVMVTSATAIYADRASGKTVGHWQTGARCGRNRGSPVRMFTGWGVSCAGRMAVKTSSNVCAAAERCGRAGVGATRGLGFRV
jgi:hypothetical protein